MIESSIFVCVLLHILCDCFLKRLSAQKVIHRFDPTSAFFVRNHIKLTYCITSVINMNANRMGAGL